MSNSADGQAVIQLQHVTKVFGHGADIVRALDDVTLTIHKGEIYGIIGMSGAGKSTLVRLINRLESPSEGNVCVNGVQLGAMDRPRLLAMRRKISMIFQQFNLLMQRTVAHNVRYPLEIAHVSKAEADVRVMELLDIVGLRDKADMYPAKLSGGQQQRVAIARALASDPDVLLCDEATSALDPQTTQSILTLLQDINRRMGITIVLITHEMAVIRQICDRVAILDNGSVAEEGSVDDVFLQTQSEAGKRLFGIVETEETAQDKVPALRIVFDGETIDRPMLSELTRALNLDVVVLSANVKHIGEKRFGQMMIRKPDDPADCARVIAYLQSIPLTVKEVMA